MTTLPPIPEAAWEAAWDAHVNGMGLTTDVMEAAYPHIVVATLRWAAKEFEPFAARSLDLFADVIEGELNK